MFNFLIDLWPIRRWYPFAIVVLAVFAYSLLKGP